MDRILVRSAVIRLVFVVLLALVALVGTAHAAPAPARPPTGDAQVAGALFTPSRTDDGIAWRAEWVLTPESANEIAGGAALALRFAVPLADGETVEPTPGVTALLENGRVTGVVVDRAAGPGRTMSALVRHRTALEGKQRYGAPVAVGHALQIVDGDLGAGTRFEVETGRTLEKGVGHVAPPGTSHAAREEARRLTGYTARVTGAAVYVRGDDVRAMGGLTAAVVTPRARGHQGNVAMAFFFGAIVLALALAMRRLRHAASVERADALLASELDALEGGPR
jgi:hypothetical protein